MPAGSRSTRLRLFCNPGADTAQLAVRQGANDVLEVGPQFFGIEPAVVQQLVFHFVGLVKNAPPRIGEGDHLAPPVLRVANPDNVSVGFQPGERLSHGLRLDPDDAGKACLGHGTLGLQYVKGNNPCVRYADGSQTLIPRMLHEPGGG